MYEYYYFLNYFTYIGWKNLVTNVCVFLFSKSLQTSSYDTGNSLIPL